MTKSNKSLNWVTLTWTYASFLVASKTINFPRQADVLQQLQVDLVTMETCGKDWGLKDMEVTDDILCARADDHGDPFTRESVCGGDSGGPLVYSTNGIHYVQHGVVSSGSNDCGDQKPTIYATINQNVVQWITNTVGKDNMPRNP